MGKKKDQQMEQYVREMIADNEKLIQMKTKYIAYGDESHGGVLAVTDRRIIYHNDTIFKGTFNVEFPYEKLSTLEQFKDGFKLFGSGIKAEFKIFGYSDLDEITKAVREQLNKSTSASDNAATSESDFISQLERLAELKKQGILTEEEFQSQKKRILEY